MLRHTLDGRHIEQRRVVFKVPLELAIDNFQRQCQLKFCHAHGARRGWP